MKTREDYPTLIAIPTIHGYDLIERDIITHLKGERNQVAIYIEGKTTPVISSACLKHCRFQ
ncbi:MAG TPA: hypothetical protein VJY62_14655 [Bacteroidia bacterium]|nr:hypothetical protein [Bacteroidia bacterium]